MRYKFLEIAPTPHHIFAQDAFRENLGKEIRIRINENVVGQGVVLEAVVSPAGDSVELTIDIPDDSEAAALIRSTMSCNEDYVWERK